MRFPILYEDNHLLVINKPAGWVTQGALPNQPSILKEAADYIKHKYSKPGDVYLGVVSRLDRPVTGVLPLARTSKAAARLSEQFRERQISKLYWAVVEGRLPSLNGKLEHWLVREEAATITRCFDSEVAHSRLAVLNYRCLASHNELHFLEIDLETGRKHQIRAQLARAGCSIVGDKKYASKRSLARGIALHCRSLIAEHPTLKSELVLKARLPADWQDSEPAIKTLLEKLSING